MPGRSLRDPKRRPELYSLLGPPVTAGYNVMIRFCCVHSRHPPMSSAEPFPLALVEPSLKAATKCTSTHYPPHASTINGAGCVRAAACEGQGLHQVLRQILVDQLRESRFVSEPLRRSLRLRLRLRRFGAWGQTAFHLHDNSNAFFNQCPQTPIGQLTPEWEGCKPQ
jgi:hypothetical protein